MKDYNSKKIKEKKQEMRFQSNQEDIYDMDEFDDDVLEVLKWSNKKHSTNLEESQERKIATALAGMGIVFNSDANSITLINYPCYDKTLLNFFAKVNEKVIDATDDINFVIKKIIIVKGSETFSVEGMSSGNYLIDYKFKLSKNSVALLYKVAENLMGEYKKEIKLKLNESPFAFESEKGKIFRKMFDILCESFDAKIGKDTEYDSDDEYCR